MSRIPFSISARPLGSAEFDVIEPAAPAKVVLSTAGLLSVCVRALVMEPLEETHQLTALVAAGFYRQNRP
jgi:hypothetical protein